MAYSSDYTGRQIDSAVRTYLNQIYNNWEGDIYKRDDQGNVTDEVENGIPLNDDGTPELKTMDSIAQIIFRIKDIIAKADDLKETVNAINAELLDREPNNLFNKESRLDQIEAQINYGATTNYSTWNAITAALKDIIDKVGYENANARTIQKQIDDLYAEFTPNGQELTATRLDEVIEEVGHTEGKPTIQVQIDELAETVSTNKTNIETSLEEAVQGLTELINENEKDIENKLAQEITNRETSDTELRDSIGASIESIESNIDRINQALGTDLPEPGEGEVDTSITGRVSTLETDLENLENTVSTQGSGIEALRTELGPVTDTTVEGFKNVYTRLEDLEGALGTGEEGAEQTITTRVAALETSLNELSNTVGAPTTQDEEGNEVPATGIHAELEKLNTDLTATNESLNEKTTISSYSTGITIIEGSDDSGLGPMLAFHEENNTLIKVNGIVTLNFMAEPNNDWVLNAHEITTGTIFATLPEGVRPKHRIYFNIGVATPVIAYIEPNGNCHFANDTTLVAGMLGGSVTYIAAEI